MTDLPRMRRGPETARMLVACMMLGLTGVPANAADAVIDATTASGDRVRLLPNGRWEFVDAQKAAVAKATADQYPENRTRPVDAQGCLAGFGRCVMPGDKDYNRGSMNPNRR